MEWAISRYWVVGVACWLPQWLPEVHMARLVIIWPSRTQVLGISEVSLHFSLWPHFWPLPRRRRRGKTTRWIPCQHYMPAGYGGAWQHRVGSPKGRMLLETNEGCTMVCFMLSLVTEEMSNWKIPAGTIFREDSESFFFFFWPKGQVFYRNSS